MYAPLYIADSQAGSAPHIPKEDAKLIMEMNADPRIVRRFGPTDRDLEETATILNPEKDAKIIRDLLNPKIPYENTDVLERRIQVTRVVGNERRREMDGWVAFYRTSPVRIPRFFKEGLLSQDNYDLANHPVLEISYARAKDAPKGLLKEGIQAEIYRLYTAVMNVEESGKALADTKWDEVIMGTAAVNNPKQISYNRICPLRIVATTDLDNIGSVNVAESLGFVNKGITTYETPEEAENPEAPDTKDQFLYELDWDKFMQIVDSKTIDSFFPPKA